MEKPVFTICIDKLELSLNGTIQVYDGSKLPNGFSVRKTNKFKNPTFDNCFDIFSDGKRFGHIFTDFNNKYRYNANAPLLLRIENSVLYETNLAYKINSFLNALSNVEFLGYYSMDIAIDGYNFVDLHQKFFNSRQLTRKAIIKGSTNTVNDKTKQQIGYIIGSKKSDKHLGIYRKQDEIIHSHKYYIKDFWDKNGLINIDNNSIDRIEGRFKAKELKTFSLNFNDLENPAYLAGFMKLKFADYLCFFKIKNPKYRRHLVQWNYFNAITLKKENKTTASPDSIFSIKITIHTLFKEFLQTGNDNQFLTFFYFIKEYKLTTWATSKIHIWRKDFN